MNDYNKILEGYIMTHSEVFHTDDVMEQTAL